MFTQLIFLGKNLLWNLQQKSNVIPSNIVAVDFTVVVVMVLDPTGICIEKVTLLIFFPAL